MTAPTPSNPTAIQQARHRLAASADTDATHVIVGPDEAKRSVPLFAVRTLQAALTEAEELRKALEPFALMSVEGLVRKDSGYVTITTQAEYFHRAKATFERSPK